MHARTRLAVIGLVVALAASLGWGTALAVQGSGGPAAGAGAAGSAGRPALAPPPALQATPDHPTPSTDGLFHAVAPCRVIDTRKAGGRLGSTVTRAFYVGGTTGFAGQGGKSGGCGVPDEAIAVVGSLTATGASGGGFVRTWPVGQSEPSATVLNYPATQSTGTGVTLALRQQAGKSLNIKNYGGPTHLVLDVTGYYTEQFTVLFQGENIYSGSKHISFVDSLQPGDTIVTFDRDLSYCVAQATAYQAGTYANAQLTVGNDLRVRTWTLSADAVPLYADAYVFLTVTC